MNTREVNPLRVVLRTHGTVYLLATSLVGRLPTAMSSLAIVQLVRLDSGSYAFAGILTAAYVVAAAVGQPVLSRRIDRAGQTRVLLASAVVSAAAFIGLAFSAAALPVVAVICALAAGLFTPPLEPSLRTLWPRMLGEGPTLKAAFSLDAGAQEVMFIVGPLLTVVGIAAFGSTGNVVFAGLLGLGGAVAFAVHPVSRGAGAPLAPPGAERATQAAAAAAGASSSSEPAADVGGRPAGHPSPLRNAAFLPVVLFTFGIGVPVGALTIVVTVFEDSSFAGFSGWALAANAFGALVGATVIALRPLRSDARRAMPICGLLLALFYIPLAFAHMPSAAYLVAAVVSGLFLPPTLTQIFETVERISARAGLTEANAWVVSSMTLGIAFGTLTAGAVASAHASSTIAVVVVGSSLITAGLSVLVLLVSRRDLALVDDD